MKKTNMKRKTMGIVGSLAATFMLVGCQSMDTTVDDTDDSADNAAQNIIDGGLEIYPSYGELRYMDKTDAGAERFFLRVTGTDTNTQVFNLRISRDVAVEMDIVTEKYVGDSFVEESYQAKDYNFSFGLSDEGRITLENLSPSAEQVRLETVEKSGSSLTDFNETDYAALDLPPTRLLNMVLDTVAGAKADQRADELAAIETARREANADSLKCNMHSFFHNSGKTQRKAARDLMDVTVALGMPETEAEAGNFVAGLFSFVWVVKALAIVGTAPALGVAEALKFFYVAWAVPFELAGWGSIFADMAGWTSEQIAERIEADCPVLD